TFTTPRLVLPRAAPYPVSAERPVNALKTVLCPEPGNPTNPSFMSPARYHVGHIRTGEGGAAPPLYSRRCGPCPSSLSWPAPTRRRRPPNPPPATRRS